MGYTINGLSRGTAGAGCECKEIEITGATENCTVEKTEADGKTQFAISVNIPEPEKCECKEVEVVSANEEVVTVTKTETDEKTTFAVDVNVPEQTQCECNLDEYQTRVDPTIQIKDQYITEPTRLVNALNQTNENTWEKVLAQDFSHPLDHVDRRITITEGSGITEAEYAAEQRNYLLYNVHNISGTIFDIATQSNTHARYYGIRIPTRADFQELANYCTFSEGTVNGEDCVIVTSNLNNAQVLFKKGGARFSNNQISAQGLAEFMVADQPENGLNRSLVPYVTLKSTGIKFYYASNTVRFLVKPIASRPLDDYYVDLGLPSGNLWFESHLKIHPGDEIDGRWWVDTAGSYAPSVSEDGYFMWGVPWILDARATHKDIMHKWNSDVHVTLADKLKWNYKQDHLIAGENISISDDNVISAVIPSGGGANGDTYGVSVNQTIKCTTTSENGHTDFKIEIDRIQPSTLIDYYGTTYTMGDVISALRNIGQLH